ncbi:MAG: GNAT family N-acetyltransferase [Alphaproteobacteria bacterium]|nr:GNAT family N-acetyltransferase [Alphaproteobacteria bacterium]
MSKDHRRAEFSCGKEALDQYIQRFARQNDEKGLGRTHVLSPVDDPLCIAGYYTLSAGSVAAASMPQEVAKSLPRYPVPVVLLARLAVSQGYQGQRLGESLLLDAFEKALAVADILGACAVQVDAIDDSAAAFYKKYGFVPMEDAPSTLFLSMKVVRKLHSE